METFRDGLCSKFLRMLEKQCDDNQMEKFLVGDSLTIADFVAASFIFNILRNELSPLKPVLEPLMDQFPHFDGYSKRLKFELNKHLSKRAPAHF